MLISPKYNHKIKMSRKISMSSAVPEREIQSMDILLGTISATAR